MKSQIFNMLLILLGLFLFIGTVLVSDLVFTRLFYPHGRGLNEGQFPAWVAGITVALAYHLTVWRRFRR